MNTLIQQLLEMLRTLQPVPSASASALRDLLRAHAATAIQQNPALANIPPGLDPLVEEAIRAGAEQAKVLNAAGTHMRLEVEDLPLGTLAADAAEQRSEAFGPFVEISGRLLRFVAYRSGAFLAVNETLAAAPVPGELILLIPAASTPDGPGLQNWALAAGTVWIRAKFLVAGALGYAGLRITGGTLRFDPAPVRTATALLVPFAGTWSLSVQPESAVPAIPASSDADAMTIASTARLDVQSAATSAATGGIAVSGFGSALNLTFGGSPFIAGAQICFPMQAAESRWSIAGNLSGIAQFQGDSPATTPAWCLPFSKTAPNLLSEAIHGGSIVVHVPGPLTSVFGKQEGGPSSWFVSTLTMNAQRVEIDAPQATSGARYDLDLWKPSTSSFQFANQPISRLLFRSERGGADTVVIAGGITETKWDMPLRADGGPFPFNGQVDVFGLLSNPSTSWVTCSATARVPEQTHGVALENLYLTVRTPRRLVLIGVFDRAPDIPSGIALLFFDVNLAVPTLPDPYAANWTLPDLQRIIEMALRITLQWDGGLRPTIAAHLDKPVRFPDAQIPAPADPDERDLYFAFLHQIETGPEALYLLDVSTRAHLFGVAVESPSDMNIELVDSRLTFPLSRIRLLMQPQVQWEAVQVEPNFQVPSLKREIAHSTSQGGPTLMGANNVVLVPTLPERVSDAILDAIRHERPAAALFSLPFGLRSMARLNSPAGPGPVPVIPPGAITEIHEPAFGALSSARQVRITARDTLAPLQQDPSRFIPGMMRQIRNLKANASGLNSVLPNEFLDPPALALTAQFANIIPLHHADLSGYGLSSFSEWVLGGEGAGFCKVQFEVLNGRTAYEVVQFRSVLYECGARSVRTVILERHNSGRVFRYDSGWVAIEPGLFSRPKPFEKGAIKAFRNIRRIRIAGEVIPGDATCAVQPVIFDADAELEGRLDLVPIYDRPGYIQVQPPPPAPSPPDAPPLLKENQLKAVFDRVGPIAGPIDALIRLGGTLDTQLSSIVSDVALDDSGGIGFAVAVVGSPKLPRAGQWNVMRIDPSTRDVTPVDPRRGVPIIRTGAQPYRFREPADARRTKPRVEHGLLMATESSRVLFAQPAIDPAQAGRIQFDLPAIMADPYSLVQSTGQFPHPSLALQLKEKALFHVALDNAWRMDNPNFNIDTAPAGRLMKGGEWGIDRAYSNGPLRIDLDSVLPAALKINAPSSDLKLNLPDFPPALRDIFKITGTYKTLSGGIPKIEEPDIVFSGALEEVKKTLHALSQLLGLPFQLDVSVTSGGGSSPSFVVHVKLVFRIGKGPEERIDIGVGKFYGEFAVQGELQAALTGAGHALISVSFAGDVQQGILPPLLYAGGLFRFRIEVHETGRPVIEMTLGVVASIGGDLIPGVLALEVTVKYGYTLIPETLEPGVLLGLDARAKLLSGLIGFSFGVEAMARIKRATPKKVTVWAHIRVAASVQVAFFIDEEVDFETQFQQDIPLAALALVPGVGLLPAATAL